MVELRCVDADGRPLDVKVYGRDAADAQLVAKAWRFLWYRRGGASLTVTRAQQVEHEALVTLLAERGGVVTPELVATAATANGDKLLVTDVLSDEVSAIGAEHLEAMWTQLDRLRDARISHGRIDVEHVRVAGEQVAIDDWATSTIEAPPSGSRVTRRPRSRSRPRSPATTGRSSSRTRTSEPTGSWPRSRTCRRPRSRASSAGR